MKEDTLKKKIFGNYSKRLITLLLVSSGLLFSCPFDSESSGTEPMDLLSLSDIQMNELRSASLVDVTRITSNFSAPPNFTVSETGDQSVTLTWATVPDAAYYLLYRSTDPKMTTEAGYFIATVEETSYTDSGLINDTTYYYTIVGARTVDQGDGNFVEETTDYSGPISATPFTTDTSTDTGTALDPLTAPTGFTATGEGGSVDLSWNAVSGAEWYEVFRSTNSGMATEADYFIGAFSGVTYTDTGLSSGVTYYYTIVAAREVVDIDSGITVEYSEYAGPVSAVPTSTPRFLNIYSDKSAYSVGDTVTITLEISDPDTKVSSVDLYLEVIPYDPDVVSEPIAATKSSGLWQLVEPYNVGDTAGTYTVFSIDISDVDGAYYGYYQDELTFPGHYAFWNESIMDYEDSGVPVLSFELQ